MKIATKRRQQWNKRHQGLAHWFPLQYYFPDGIHFDIIAIFSLCYIYKQASGTVMGM